MSEEQYGSTTTLQSTTQHVLSKNPHPATPSFELGYDTKVRMQKHSQYAIHAAGVICDVAFWEYLYKIFLMKIFTKIAGNNDSYIFPYQKPKTLRQGLGLDVYMIQIISVNIYIFKKGCSHVFCMCFDFQNPFFPLSALFRITLPVFQIYPQVCLRS